MSNAYKIHNQQSAYFLTFRVVDWVDVFIRAQYKDVIISNLRYCIENKGLELFAYVIMTNHIHIICRAKEPFKLSDVIRDFKKHSANQILNLINEPFESRKWMLNHFSDAGKLNPRNTKYQFWNQKNHAEELFSPKFINQKVDYIHNNPVKAGFVAKPEDYLYSSARNYAGLESVIEVIKV